MKSFLLIILILTSVTLAAQTYHPFPTKNTIWSEMYYNPYPNYKAINHYFGLRDNDTIIKNKLYHKLYHSTDTIFTEDKLCGGLREENKKVYYYSIVPVRFSYTDIPKDTEVVLYNFSFKVGDTIKNYGPDRGHPLVRLTYMSFLVIVSKIDSILIGDSYRKRFRFSDMTTENIIPFNSWIEGIGLSRGLLFSIGDLPNNGLWNDMVCFKQGNNILYHCNEWCYRRYDDCYYIKTKIQEIKTIGNIKVRPNPVLIKGNIEVPVGKFDVLTIINLSGIEVKKLNIAGQSSVDFSREGLPSGLYFMKLTGKQGYTANIKVIFE